MAASPVPGAGVVDSHHHVWDLAVRPQPWLDQPGLEPLRRAFTEPDLLPQARAAGVTASVVVQTVVEPAETPELLSLAAGSGLVAAVVGWADLRAPDVADTLAALRARPDGSFLRGIRHPLLIENDPEWLLRPDVRRGLGAVAAAGLCFDLAVMPHQLPAAVAAAAAHPGLTFVLDHLGNPEPRPAGPDQRWAGLVRQFAALPNTACKLSGILGELDPAGLAPYAETVLAAFGPGRLMFGTDWPVCTVSASYAGVVAAGRAVTAGLSPDEREAVLGGTACRVYRLRTLLPEPAE
ncbi:MAG: amidohydrolase family protein [Nocardiopsaceae bacterium]|nr:amidohydrolase family protein [Nocardiopsaceae bacterium]